MEFPERIYTAEELKKARELVKKGYKHHMRIKGSRIFEEKVREAFKLVKDASYYDYLRTYIRSVVEIDGITQLREADAAIWANEYAVRNPVDAASLFIQKANQMKQYLEGKLYFNGVAEARSVEKRIEFLKALKEKSSNKEVREESAQLLRRWTETVFL